MKKLMTGAIDRRLSNVVMTREMKDEVLRRLARGEEAREVRPRRRLATALVAALLGTLLLATLAYANRDSQILRWMFYGREPNETALNLVQPESREYEQDGIRVKLVESMIDTSQMALTWQVESLLDEPVLVNVERFGTVTREDGRDVAIYGEGLLLLGGEVEGKAFGKSFIATDFGGGNWDLDEAFSGPQQVRFQLDVYRPLASMIMEQPGRKTDKNGNMQLYARQDALSFSAGGVTSTYDYRAVREENERQNKLLDEHWGDPDFVMTTALETMANEGLIEPFTSLDWNFTLTPDQSKQSRGTRVVGQNRFEFDEYTLVVKQMSFTATDTQIAVEIWPKRPIQADEYGYPVEEKWQVNPMNFLFLDENGTDILSTCGGGAAGGPVENRPGKAYFEYGWGYGPAEHVPQTVTIAPVSEFDWLSKTHEEFLEKRRAHALMDEAVTVTLETIGAE